MVNSVFIFFGIYSFMDLYGKNEAKYGLFMLPVHSKKKFETEMAGAIPYRAQM